MNTKLKFTSFIFVLLLISFFVFSQTNPPADWNKIGEAWNVFVETPSEDNLNRVLDILPVNGKAVDNASAGAAVIEQILQNIGRIETMVIESNIVAVRTAFRLFTISYGEMENQLCRILGNLIGFNTVLFLTELEVNQSIIPSMENVLGSFKYSNLGPAEQETERKYRINMFERIDDKNLKNIRNDCLKVLKKLEQ